MAQAKDYESLFRELLAGVTEGWTYGSLKGWLMAKVLSESELAGWLRDRGAGLAEEAAVREQLGYLAGLRRGELAEVAEDLVKGWEVEVDEAEEWFDRGKELIQLGRYEEAIANYDRVIELKHDYHLAWFIRGGILSILGRDEEAIASYDKALEFKPDDDDAWNCRGFALGNLGRFEEAIASYDKALAFKPDKHEAWFNRGNTLNNLGRFEEAIASWDKALEFKLDDDAAWVNRGIALKNLGRYEEAIASYDRALEFKPDYYKAWYNRGIALENLGRYEEAIASYDRALEFKPDDDAAWVNRGVALSDLGRLEEAIASFYKALEFKPDFYQAWVNRGIVIDTLHGYRAEIDAYHQAFRYIRPDTHPEGWGVIQHRIGRTHYQEGKKQLFGYRKSPQIYYGQALTAYQNALQTLTAAEFPELRLKTLIDLAQVYLAQNNLGAASESQAEAVDIFRALLNAQPTFEGKKRLQVEYSGLRRFDVDLFVARGDRIRALEAAELDKNNYLTWLLSQLEERTISPSYAQMRGLLGNTQAEGSGDGRNPPKSPLERGTSSPPAPNSGGAKQLKAPQNWGVGGQTRLELSSIGSQPSPGGWGDSTLKRS